MPVDGVNGTNPAGQAGGQGNAPFGDIQTQQQFDAAIGQAFAQILAPMVQMVLANTGE